MNCTGSSSGGFRERLGADEAVAPELSAHGIPLSRRLTFSDVLVHSPIRALPAVSRSPDAECRVCAGSSRFVFEQEVLAYKIGYFDCPHCGYLQTETPYWLNEAYVSAINDADTGILKRNQQNVGKVIVTLLSLGVLKGTVVDYASGYGILVRLLRDAGVNALWTDKYCENLLARGFEAKSNRCDLLTAFEVFEHLVEPVSELRAMLAEAPAVLLSTELIRSEQAPPTDWWYFGKDHGQHVGFFRVRTLQTMARMLGCHYDTDGRSIHLFSSHAIPRTWRPLAARSNWWRAIARGALRSRTISDSEQIVRARAATALQSPASISR